MTPWLQPFAGSPSFLALALPSPYPSPSGSVGTLVIVVCGSLLLRWDDRRPDERGAKNQPPLTAGQSPASSSPSKRQSPSWLISVPVETSSGSSARARAP